MRPIARYRSRLHAPRRAFAGVILYFVLCWAIPLSFNLALPKEIESALSAIMIPATWLIAFWNSHLTLLDWLSARPVRMPVSWAMTTMVLAFASVAALLAWIVASLFGRSR